MESKQLWFSAPGEVEIRIEDIPLPGPDQVLVKSQYSAISSGTELLAFRGQIPENLKLDENIKTLKNQQNTFPFRYGYATVGTIEEIGDGIEKSFIGKNVFAFQPHCSHFISSLNELHVVPDGIELKDAVFLANIETAVNLIQDGKPLLGETIVVIGLGVVGLFVTRLLANMQINNIYVLEPIKQRCELVNNIENCKTFSPDLDKDMAQLHSTLSSLTSRTGADLVYELTGNPDALNLAIDVCGYNSRIVVGSWYGIKTGNINLGGNFHRNRINIISSQVSTINPELTGRWNKVRRMDLTWNIIKTLTPHKYISNSISFDRAAQAYEMLDKSPENSFQILLEY